MRHLQRHRILDRHLHRMQRLQGRVSAVQRDGHEDGHLRRLQRDEVTRVNWTRIGAIAAVTVFVIGVLWLFGWVILWIGTGH